MDSASSVTPQQVPTVGRIVLYRLSDIDVSVISRTRDGQRSHVMASDAVPGSDVWALVPRGNSVRPSETYPALIVRVFDTVSGTLNLQVFLDGNDSYWATSRMPGDDPGQWSWPVRQ